jgi:hypothetical protein
MPSWERVGLIHFVSLLVVRRILGEEDFLHLCRQAGQEYLNETGRGPFPGSKLYPWDAKDWEVHGQIPSIQDAAGPAVILLLSHLQRAGNKQVEAALKAFTERYQGRRARLAELLVLLDRPGT